MEYAAVALAIFAEQSLNVFRVFPDPLFIAIVAIDEHNQMAGVERHLSPFIVACRSAHTSLRIAIDG